jgi:aconitate hydratase
VNIDMATQPLGHNAEGKPVFLADVWPSDEEVQAVVKAAITPELFRAKYADVTNEPRWDAIEAIKGDNFIWKDESTYVRNPPFFQNMDKEPGDIQPIEGARVLLKLGDSITTDHISPAGEFKASTPAGRYLVSKGVEPADFNSYGSRRGNHEVMMRGTFANVRIRNQVAPGTEGGVTTCFLDGKVESVYDASMKYQDAGVPLVVLAGEQYGTGSSRDWAAKGTFLLGVKAVITKSFERIHRSNLVGMGVLPLCYKNGQDAESLGLDGTEVFTIVGLNNDVKPGQDMDVIARKADGTEIRFTTQMRLDTPVEVNYYRNGGILQTVLRKMAQA